MTKNVNIEWMQDLLNNDKRAAKETTTNELPKIDWVQNNKGFKKKFIFKAIPANSQENGVHSTIVAQHWIDTGAEKNKRFICPEQTVHLKKQNVTCPVCEAKRKLKAKGFSEDDLKVEGKYGPVSAFDPQITSNMKVVVMESDTVPNWDKAHISVFQQKGTFPTTWLMEKYVEKNVPDFLNMESSNLVEYKRDSDNGKWERSISFATFTPSADVLVKLKEENEALTLPDLWKMPADADILEVRQLMEGKIQEFETAKSAVETVSQDAIDDDIPF